MRGRRGKAHAKRFNQHGLEARGQRNGGPIGQIAVEAGAGVESGPSRQTSHHLSLLIRL